MGIATQKTIKFFKEKGHEVQIVERFIQGVGVRKDFLGCIDLMIMKEGKKTIIGIQCFTTKWTEHERKICKEYPEGAKFWLSLKRTKLYFFGWRKLKVKRGGKAVRWMPRIGQITLTKKGKLKLIEGKHPWEN